VEKPHPVEHPCKPGIESALQPPRNTPLLLKKNPHFSLLPAKFSELQTRHHAVLSARWGHASGKEQTLPGVRNPPASPRGASCSVSTVSPLPSPPAPLCFSTRAGEAQTGRGRIRPFVRAEHGPCVALMLPASPPRAAHSALD